MKAFNKTNANLKIKELKRSIHLVLNDEGLTSEEKLYARTAYLNLNALRNSLYRFLIKKKA